MDRRNILFCLAGLPFVAKASATNLPWAARFVAGHFDGEFYQAGLVIRLDAGWKTYWRNPGEAGIPPQITVATSSNLESLTFNFPLPQRFIDDSGEAIGYHDEVLFPIFLKPRDFTKPLQVSLDAFFGVCEQVCTPARVNGVLDFSPSSGPLAATELIALWQSRVPQSAAIVKGFRLAEKFLVLDLSMEVLDLFVEGPDRYYFTKPDFEREAGKAWIAIKGLKSAAQLAGVKLRITANHNGQGLEQEISLP